MRALFLMMTAAGFAMGSNVGRCDRACLEGFVDRYLAALVGHDPSALPLAPVVMTVAIQGPLTANH
jgi:hypothetical protein